MVTIVDYSETYAQAVSSIFVSTFVRGGYSSESFAEELRPEVFTRRGTVLVTVETNQVVGTVVLVPPSSPHKQITTQDEAELHLLAVAEGTRGRSIGAALIGSVIDRARELGFKQLILSTQPSQGRADRAYERSGFGRVSERDWARPAGGTYLVYARER